MISLAIIGGSGLYQMEGLTDVELLQMDTPFGPPSDTITIGTLYGKRIAFLPRHGRNHHLTPTEVPYQANIMALKQLGVRYCVAVSACGSLRESFAPGDIVVPDQLYDHTKLRSSTFFGGGLVAHVGVADPFSAQLSRVIADTVREVGGTVHEGGKFITIEGPRFSTKAESRLFQQWGMEIIGMTSSPEAFLAREAEIAYACMAHVTDYDVWHQSAQPVTVEMVIRTLRGNTQIAQRAIALMAKTMDQWAVEMTEHSALQNAIMSHHDHISAESRARLALLVDRYLD